MKDVKYMFDISKKNKNKSYFIICIFTVILSIIIYAICNYFELGITGVIIAILFAILTSWATYYNSDKIVLSLNGARPATKEENQLMYENLEGLCIAAGLPMPKLYIMEDASPNAFATGRNPQNAVICVTTGLMKKLDTYELEGVLAHELSHIKNYDILLQTIASVFVSITTILSDFFLRITIRGGRNRDNDSGSSISGILTIIGMILLILSPLIAPLLKLALSRRREFLADSSAVELTRNPQGLIDALKKISSDPDPLEQANKSTASLYFSCPLNTKGLNKLYSTHPPIEDRIKALENIH